MRFKSLHIKEAGPLKDKKIHFKDVNLIVGNNEEGKTTLMDILIQTLFGKKIPYNKGLWNERFDFEGKAEVETEGEKPGPEELKYNSLFIIREGDMKWQGKSSGKREMLSKDMWNDDIREVLYGSDEVYSKINKKAVELMGVSPGKGWMLKLLSNLEELDGVIERETGRTEEFKRNESQIAAARKQLAGIENELEGMTDARKVSASLSDKELIERYFKKTDEWNAVREELEALRKKDLDSVRQEWEKLERSAAEMDKEIAGRDISRASLETRKKEKRNTMESVRGRIEGLRVNLNDIELDRKKKIMERENGERILAENRERLSGKGFRAFRRAMTVLAVSFFALTAAAGTFTLLIFLKAFPWEMDVLVPALSGTAAFLSAWVFLLVRMVRSSRMKKKLAESDNQWGGLLQQIRYSIENLEKEAGRLQEQMNGYLEEMNDLNCEIKEMENGTETFELEKRKKDLENSRTRLGELARSHRSLGELNRQIEKRETLAEKQEDLSLDMKDVTARLNKKYGTDSASFLREELKKLKEEIGQLPADKNYNEERFERLLNDKDRLGDELSQKLRENERIKAEVLTKTGEALKNVPKDVKRDFLDAFYSEIGILDLKGDLFNVYALGGRVKDMIMRVKEDMCLAGLFLITLDKVQSDIGALIDGVLNTDRFRAAVEKLTNGNYRAVEAREEGDEFRFYLSNAKDEAFEFSTLSTGTRNQVYFAIRLALAAHLFRDQRGVFLLDDAFLSFDEGRRKSAAELLGEYAQEGWQVVYSAVNEKNMEDVFDGVFGKKLNKITL